MVTKGNPGGGQFRMVFYLSSDGPRIMFVGTMEARIDLLQRELVSLGQRPALCRFEDLPFVVADDGLQLHAISDHDSLGASESAKQSLLRERPDQIHFIWERSASGWKELAQLLEGLRTIHQPAHQYLTRYPVDDATVVVSKGEYPIGAGIDPA